jgi:hypothetical protein
MLPLRLLIYDRTCRGTGLPGLSTAWAAGARLYRARGLLDAHYAAASWGDALRFLATEQPERALGEVQFWGHGKWGDARIASEVLDERALLQRHALCPELSRVRARLAPGALWWFRTCETFGAERGLRFATAWTDFLGARAAGHTYIIGFWQSGLHVLEPGATPDWSPDEGLARGTARAPEQALWSRPGEPNTITCLQGVLPDASELRSRREAEPRPVR